MIQHQPPAIPVQPIAQTIASTECPEKGDCDRRAKKIVLELERLCRQQSDPNKVVGYRNAIASLSRLWVKLCNKKPPCDPIGGFPKNTGCIYSSPF
ncbi:hypothetical protein [Allocoleopsis sp.]|uniref:hypothetical protein n=1 Tax=Allocoleopsis sp. TaxID=3088169 RepID=UPI002FD212B5